MSTKPPIDDLFEPRLTYPDFAPQARLARLVGLDDHKARLTKMLGLLVNPARLQDWRRTHHPDAAALVDAVGRRPPLVVLAGDVGSGKPSWPKRSATPSPARKGSRSPCSR
jgi:hypothetical protein